MANKPTGITKVGAGGDQAVNIQVLPDLMSASWRASLLKNSKKVKIGIDIDETLKYNV